LTESKIKVYADRKGSQLFSGELSDKPVDIGQSVNKTVYLANGGERNLMVEVSTNHPEIRLRGETTFNIAPEDIIPITIMWTPSPDLEDEPLATPFSWVERYVVG